MRQMNQVRRWGPILLISMFVVLASDITANAGIVSAEYFIDTDPGIGNGLPLQTVDGSWDGALEFLYADGIESDVLDVGEHTLYVRVLDDQDNWGIARQVKFNVIAANPYKKLVEGEYFINTDPGAGNGIPLIAHDGAFDEAIETAVKDSILTDTLCAGEYMIFVRFRDNFSYWPSFTGWGPLDSAVLTVHGEPCPPVNFDGTTHCEVVNLSWLPSYSATKYLIYRGDTLHDSIAVASYQDSVYDGLSHCYRVAAKNQYGEGSLTSEICRTAPARPAAPVLTIPNDLAVSRPPDQPLCWDTIEGCTAYHLQVNDQDDFSGSLLYDGDALSIPCTNPFLFRNGKTYHWRVRTLNHCGWGQWSSSRQFSTMLSSIEGLVYNECGHEGVRTPEVGVIILLRYDSLGPVIAQGTTGNDGMYRFDNLIDTSYFVGVGDLCDTVIYALDSLTDDAPGFNIKHLCDGNQPIECGYTDLSNDRHTGIPERFSVDQNHPNPFNPTTTIEFALPRAAFTTVAVYNIIGQMVRSLVTEQLQAGYKSVVWDGRDEQGHTVASGIYLYRIEADAFEQTKKMVLMK